MLNHSRAFIAQSFKSLHCSLVAPTLFKNYPIVERKLFLERKLLFKRKIFVQRKHPLLQRKLVLIIN